MTAPLPSMPLKAAGPAVRRRRLAGELRQLRLDAGLTMDEVAEKLEWSAAKISRIESAQVSVLPRDVKFLLGVYGTSSDSDRLLALARESRQKAWWHKYGVTAVPAWLRTYAALEADAAVLSSYHPELVPALLQTSGYHAAIQLATVGEDNSESAVLLRARQERLAVAGTPHVHAIVSEAVLRRPVGGPAVMTAQLDHLAQISHKPGVTIQVLPFTSGAHPAMDSPLTLMTFPDPADPDVACTGPPGAMCLDGDADVQHFQRVLARLQDMALPAEASLTLISQAAADLARHPATGRISC